MYKLSHFKKLILLIFIWQIIRLFVVRPEIHKWRLPMGLTEWGWNDSVDHEANMDREFFLYNETTISTWDIGENSETLPVSSNEESPIYILLWTQFNANRDARIRRWETLAQKMRKNICFQDCRFSMGGNQSDAEAADAIVFDMHREGIKQKMLPLRTSWTQIWVYIQHEPPVHYVPKAHLNGIFNWTMTYRLDSDIYNPYYRLLPLAKSLKRTDPLTFGNRQYNSLEWFNGKTMLAIAVISNCNAASKRLPILQKLQSIGIPIDIFGDCGNQSIPIKETDEEEEFWNEIGRNYMFFFAIENSICVDYVTEKFWRPMELGMVPIVMGRARYLEIGPPNSYIDMRDFPNPIDLAKYLRFLANEPKAYFKFFEWRRHYNVVHSMWDLCDLCAKLKQHKRRIQQDLAIYGDDYYEYEAHMDLTGWWNTSTQQNSPACISPEEFGFKNYL